MSKKKDVEYLVVDAANEYGIVAGSPFPTKEAAEVAVADQHQLGLGDRVERRLGGGGHVAALAM